MHLSLESLSFFTKQSKKRSHLQDNITYLNLQDTFELQIHTTLRLLDYILKYSLQMFSW